ncbi:MAG: sulfite exporter TauE/SafE family protein [Deltaproteobacteria bacterium]|nr:MAG: sulfite exporter TauE/SafE family protein [Deltaproteobacteria bacterium]
MTLVLDGHVVSVAAVTALGAGVGVVAGMFGVGGGFLMVPLMHVALGIPLPFAVGAALCQTIATGLAAFLRYRKLGLAEWRFDAIALAGSLVGVDAGTRLLLAMEGMGTVVVAGKPLAVQRAVVSGVYAVSFTVLAYVLWCKTTPGVDEEVQPGPLARIRLPPYIDLPAAGLRRVSAPAVAYTGLANGVLAGLLGIGGGIMMIPILLYGFGFHIRRAAGSGILIVLAVAVLATVQHAHYRTIHLGLVIPLMVGAALAAQVGANLTRTLPARTLRRGLAVVLLATVAALLFKLTR